MSKQTFEVKVLGVTVETRDRRTHKVVKPYKSLREIIKQYKKNNRNTRIASLLKR